MISGLVSAGLRVYADIAERNAAGTITDADIDLLLSTLGTKADAWETQIQAHRAAKATKLI